MPACAEPVLKAALIKRKVKDTSDTSGSRFDDCGCFGGWTAPTRSHFLVALVSFRVYAAVTDSRGG